MRTLLASGAAALLVLFGGPRPTSAQEASPEESALRQASAVSQEPSAGAQAEAARPPEGPAPTPGAPAGAPEAPALSPEEPALSAAEPTPDLISSSDAPAPRGDSVPELVRRGREAAGDGDYATAAHSFARARVLAPDLSWLDVEYALAAWQTGQDGLALEVLSRSIDEDAPVLIHALRMGLDPAEVLALDRPTRAGMESTLEFARTELIVGQAILWGAALGGTAAVITGLALSCSPTCDVSPADAAAAISLTSLGVLVVGLGLTIDAHARRDGVGSMFRADARGLAVMF